MLAKLLVLCALLVASSSYPSNEEDDTPTSLTSRSMEEPTSSATEEPTSSATEEPTSSATEEPTSSATEGTTPPAAPPTTAVSPVSRECTQAGLLCTDCSHLVICMETASGFQATPVATCSEQGSLCSESWLNCSSKLSACSNNDIFKCHAQGFFPDPYDCNVFYECGEGSEDEYDYSTQLVCPPQTAYNAATEDCSLPITSEICRGSPVPQCGSTFSAAPLPANANLYYICVDSKPKIYKCPDGGSFNANTLACESSAFHCPGIGTFADPKDCHRYYTCSDMDHYTHHSCFIGFYFDEKKKRCILGTC